MSLANIIKKIDDEADAQAREIIEQARIEDDQIRSYARIKSTEEAEQILHHAETELETLKKKQMATLLLHLRKEKLDNRQQILRSVFKEVLKRVLEHDNDEQRRTMFKNILLSVSEERKATILASPADKSTFDQAFIETINEELARQHRKLQFTLSHKTADIERGFLLDFKDFEINYSIETLLANLWEEMKSDVSQRLFDARGTEKDYGNS